MGGTTHKSLAGEKLGYPLLLNPHLLPPWAARHSPPTVSHGDRPQYPLAPGPVAAWPPRSPSPLSCHPMESWPQFLSPANVAPVTRRPWVGPRVLDLLPQHFPSLDLDLVRPLRQGRRGR